MMSPNEDLTAFAATISWLTKESNRIVKLSKKPQSKKALEKNLKDVTEIAARLQSLKREFESRYGLGK